MTGTSVVSKVMGTPAIPQGAAPVKETKQGTEEGQNSFETLLKKQPNPGGKELAGQDANSSIRTADTNANANVANRRDSIKIEDAPKELSKKELTKSWKKRTA